MQHCKGWDGYNSDAFTQETLDYARRILDCVPEHVDLDVACGAGGAICCEWYPTNLTVRKLFFDIEPTLIWHAYWLSDKEVFGRMEGKGFTDTTARDIRVVFNQFKELS